VLSQHWRFLQHLRETSFKNYRLVLTSPNATALIRIVGRDERVYEGLDDGVAIDVVVQAVRGAARRARPANFAGASAGPKGPGLHYASCL
jgi:hypothetical protein